MGTRGYGAGDTGDWLSGPRYGNVRETKEKEILKTVMKRVAFLLVFVSAMVVWFLAMTGLQYVVLPFVVGPLWAQWWGFVISFAGGFWMTLWFLERWATWTAKGKL